MGLPGKITAQGSAVRCPRCQSRQAATMYDLMRSGRLRSVKDGGKRFITLDALRDYIRQLEDDADEVA